MKKKKVKKETTKPKTEKITKDLSQCCCDWTAHCPVHGSRKFDPNSYIAQG